MKNLQKEKKMNEINKLWQNVWRACSIIYICYWVFILILYLARVIRNGFRQMYRDRHFQIETALKLSDPEIRKRFMKPNENAAHRF